MLKKKKRLKQEVFQRRKQDRLPTVPVQIDYFCLLRAFRLWVAIS